MDERFCALRHGTDAAGLAEHTVAAHPAGLAEDACTLDLSEKQRVIRGEDRDRGIGRDSLCAVAAGQTDDGLRAAVAQGLEIALGAAGAADQRDAANTAQHRKHLLHGLFSCYDHMLLLKKQKTERAKRRRALFVNLKDSPG